MAGSIPGTPPPPYPGQTRPPFRARWSGFVIILAVLLTVGAASAFMWGFGVAMMADPCGGDSTQRLCRMSPRGQGTLLLIPWISVGTFGAGSVVAAMLAVRGRRTPLLGIAAGLAIGFITLAVGIWIAFHT